MHFLQTGPLSGSTMGSFRQIPLNDVNSKPGAEVGQMSGRAITPTAVSAAMSVAGFLPKPVERRPSDV